MINSVTILAAEDTKLRQASQRRQGRQQQRRQYIARGGALQAVEGQLLAAEAERVVQQVEQEERAGRQRAPPTCSNCHEQGHKRLSVLRDNRYPINLSVAFLTVALLSYRKKTSR